MIYAHLVVIILCSRWAIACLRVRDDWWAAFAIGSALLNVSAIVRGV